MEKSDSTINVLGYETSAAGLSGDIASARNVIDQGSKGAYMACANPHSLVVARRDDLFRDALVDADILLPDGIGVVFAAKLLGENLSERVAGSDFFAELSRQAEKCNGLRYFFLGSTDHVLEKLVDRLQREYPAVEVCGVFSPPFKAELDDADNDLIIERINNARPDVLWVGMTAPKQEKWIYKNKHRLNVPLTGAIGAVFDFYAGTKKRAPEWVCKLGLEWLPRLLREPKRLFRRNFISSPLFILLVLRQKMRSLRN